MPLLRSTVCSEFFLARIRALTKRAALPREKLDVNGLVAEVVALVRDQAMNKKVAIRAELAEGLPPVSGDRVQLQQVLLNLAINAIDAMRGTVDRARELTIFTRKANAAHVEVAVQDSGTGIDPDTMAKIFNAFYTTKPDGMGMGLSISRSIVQNHGGQLWATNNEGPGATFHFTLPVA